MHPLLLDIRQFELEAVRADLPPGSRVLELGAGNGWQAKQLTEWGHTVSAVDVDHEQGREEQFFDVELYDGVHLPFGDDAVDVVYSSNVFEHVKDVPGLLAEVRRVLAPGGCAVHVLPSPTWRAWTILTRYPYLCLLAAGRRRLPAAGDDHGRGGADPAGPLAAVRTRSGSTGLLGLAVKALKEQPHGEFPSAPSELIHYRSAAWRAKFEAAGFRILDVRPVGLFYTGYGISGLPLGPRRRLARALGSACTVFVMDAG